MEDNIFIACQEGDLERLEQLIKEGVDPSCRKSEGSTLLHIAVRWDQLKIVKYLRTLININAQDAWGMTPLHRACQVGSLTMIKDLCDHGANINCQCNMGTPLYFACLRCRFDVVEYLCSIGADPTISGIDGWMPLHMASLIGHTDMVTTIASCYI